MAYQLMAKQIIPPYSNFQSDHETLEAAQSALYAVERTAGDYGVVDTTTGYVWATLYGGWTDQYGNPIE